MQFFFFGSLMDADVRAIVLGRPLPDRRCRRARIDGYRRVRAVGKSYPMLLPAPGYGAVGLVVQGLSRSDAARLRYFEGTAYRLARRTVTLDDGATCPAHLFLAASGLHPLRKDWDFAAWQQQAKRRFVATAKRRMAGWRKLFASA
jgi:hypothetical protein